MSEPLLESAGGGFGAKAGALAAGSVVAGAALLGGGPLALAHAASVDGVTHLEVALTSIAGIAGDVEATTTTQATGDGSLLTLNLADLLNQITIGSGDWKLGSSSFDDLLGSTGFGHGTDSLDSLLADVGLPKGMLGMTLPDFLGQDGLNFDPDISNLLSDIGLSGITGDTTLGTIVDQDLHIGNMDLPALTIAGVDVHTGTVDQLLTSLGATGDTVDQLFAQLPTENGETLSLTSNLGDILTYAGLGNDPLGSFIPGLKDIATGDEASGATSPNYDGITLQQFIDNGALFNGKLGLGGVPGTDGADGSPGDSPGDGLGDQNLDGLLTELGLIHSDTSSSAMDVF